MRFNLTNPIYLAIQLCLLLSITMSYAQTNSVLSSGDWYKLAVSNEGVYKIDYSFLQDIGIDPTSINPNHIKIYGNGGKMLPQANNAVRPIDLIENAIWVEGASDGSFDSGDYILFFGQSPDSVNYNASTGTFDYSTNIFEDKTYYFLTIGNSNGKRIGNISNQGLDFPVVNSYDYYDILQEEKTSVIISGREWYGDRFDATNTHTYSFDISEAKINGKLKLTSAVMAQSYAESSYDIFINDTQIGSQIISGVTTYQYGQKGLDAISVFDYNTPPNDIINVKLRYNRNNSGKSVGYLNYLIIHAERNLVQQDQPIVFRSISSLNQPLSTFSISGTSSNSVVWDVSDPFQPLRQETSLSDGQLKFGAVTVILNEYVLFDKTLNNPPEFLEKINNQNIRNNSFADLLIISHPEFLGEAERLAAFRRSNDGYTVIVVTTEQVYNEFSGGSMDFTALRDFTKYIYDQQGVKHLLLFGKGTYDYKDVLNKQLNIVPTYQSRNSLHPLLTYSSDDYYGLMEDKDGHWEESIAGDETLDIGVGRLPVKTIEEATGVVDKLINYSSNLSFGKWKNKIVFVADDGDYNIHQKQAHQLANFVDTAYTNFETQRLFLDNYKQESRPNGEISPAAQNEINETVNSGALIVNYTGHGGEVGWTQEGVLDVFMIDNWNNKTKLPLFVTATCEFGRHDDPRRDSGGEKTILNNNGGAIAIVTTTRPVNSSTNFELNKAFYNVVFSKNNGLYLPLGDIFKHTKNNSLSGSSNRNFSLLGDPSMRIAYPKYTLDIDKINGKEVSVVYDTLKALSLTRVEGHVNSNGQIVSTFNGTAFITVYDKLSSKKTLGNENSPFTYTEWDNVLYKGQVSVSNGVFNSEFVIPKNIDYNTGEGRISLFAIDDSNKIDAHGADIKIPIGISGNSVADTQPPSIQLFINDTTFSNGGITGENILLLAQLFDENGINTSSKHVTNNITASLDGTSSFLLNDYYVADLDTYKSGWVAFPINDLSPGEHFISFSASDTHNNVSEKTISFIVTNSGDFIIQELGNYPNPVNSHTNFFVTHNRSGDDLELGFKIMKVSGEVVASVSKQYLHCESTINIYEWRPNKINLSKGIYIFSVKMRSLSDGAENQRFQKFIKIY